MSGPKLPSPLEAVVDQDGLVTQPWYQYFNARETLGSIVTVSSTNGIAKEGCVTVITTTTTVAHLLDDPAIGNETTIIVNLGTTNSNPITVVGATDVAIGPSGENALSFASNASTYEYIKLLGTSTGQYHILYRTTGVSVTASS